MRKQFANFVKVLFAVSLIYWLVKTDRLNLEKVGPFLSFEGIGVGLFLTAANIIILGERWRYLARTNLHSLGVWLTFKLNLIGLFFNFAMPGGVGGDVIKAYYLQKDLGLPRSFAFSSALMDRVAGLYTAVLMALTALGFEYWVQMKTGPLVTKLLTSVALLFLAQTIGFILLVFWKWPESWNSQTNFIGKFFRFLNTCRDFVKSPRRIAVAIGITALGQLFTILFFGWAIQNILGQQIDLATLFFVVPVGFMVMAIPLTPAGIGVGQAAFFYLFQSFSETSEGTGSLVITAFQMFQLFWGLVGAFFYLTRPSGVDISQTQKSR